MSIVGLALSPRVLHNSASFSLLSDIDKKGCGTLPALFLCELPPSLRWLFIGINELLRGAQSLRQRLSIVEANLLAQISFHHNQIIKVNQQRVNSSLLKFFRAGHRGDLTCTCEHIHLY